MYFSWDLYIFASNIGLSDKSVQQLMSSILFFLFFHFFPAASVASSPFTFSLAPSGGFGASQTPSFGSSFGSPFTATPSQTPAFGANTNATPVFGQQAYSAPVFDSASNSAPGMCDCDALIHFTLRLFVVQLTKDCHCCDIIADQISLYMLCSSGGFQFGGAGAFGATNNSPGVFTFGAGGAASPAPSANPSITPQPGATGGGFNFAQPPTFNIG